MAVLNEQPFLFYGFLFISSSIFTFQTIFIIIAQEFFWLLNIQYSKIIGEKIKTATLLNYKIKKMYTRSTLIILSLIISSRAFTQQKLETTALNRITFVKNDTVYRFFILKPGKKVNAKPGLNYYWFKPDTILITNSGYDGRLLNGEYKTFYPNKNIKEYGMFDEGLKTGEWKTWSADGKLLQIYNWKKGHLDGKFIIYSIDGKINQQGNYIKDSISVRKDKENK